MSLPRYDKYKTSGVEWLGEVPEHWEVKPNKTFLTHSQKLVGESWKERQLLSLTLKGVIDRDIHSGHGKYPSDFGTYQEVVVGDLVFCLFDMDETPRTVGLAGSDGMITSAYDVFRCRSSASASFVVYYFLHIDSFKGLRPFYTGLRKVVRPPTFMAIKVPMPPIAEQTKIASFLDRETSKIDGLVGEQRRLIELLKEKRQAVISHAVTKGLNPHAPLKPSGIEWLGDVPEHWEVKTVRYACQIDNTLRFPIDAQTRSDLEGEYPYFGPTGILSWINEYRVEGEYFLLGEDGDHFLKFEKQSMTILVEGKFNVNNHAHLVRGIGDCSTKWAYRYFEHRDLLPWLIKQGVGRYKLRKETLQTIPIVIPPRTEQREILGRLDEMSSTTATLISEAERAIELLQERRTALISAAVTGQIDVRGLVETEAP